MFFRSSAKGGANGTDQVDAKPAAANGNGVHIEVAQEATEVARGSGPGFLKRAVSKLWKVPIEGLNGVPYTDIDSPPPTPSPAPRVSTNGKDAADASAAATPEATAKSCVIS